MFGRKERGFTLLEMTLVVAILAVLAAITYNGLKSMADGTKYETTRSELDAIKIAILGDATVDPLGHRVNFGYVGDWGSLPSALSNLTTSQTPAWSFNTTYGVGAGWNGPYLRAPYTGIDPTLDAWQNGFVYAPGATPATVTSYGSDGAAGGTFYAQDLVLQIPASQYQATVYGTVLSAGSGVSGVTVEIRYPVAGTLTAFTTTTASDGSFSFSSVPFGIRSLRTTTAPLMGPFPINVDSAQYQVPTSVLTAVASGSVKTHAVLWHDEDKVISGNPITRLVDTTQNYAAVSGQRPSNNGDTFQQSFELAAGNYVFSVLGATTSTSGKIDWYLDGTLVVPQQDWYSSSTTKNVYRTANLTLFTSGDHILKGVVNGKNASSTGYDFAATKFVFGAPVATPPGLSYVAGSASESGGGTYVVNLQANSTYTTAMQITQVTVSWTGGAGRYLETVVLNGNTFNAGMISSGTNLTINPTVTVPANTNGLNFSVTTCWTSSCTGRKPYNPATYTIIIYYQGTTSTDTLSFTI